MVITLYKYKYQVPDQWQEEVDYAYLKELEAVGFVDDYISCIFQRSWAGIGEWEIIMPKDSPHIQEFYEAQFIRIHHKAAGIINKAKIDINEEAQTITFSGYELKGVYNLRATKGNYTNWIQTNIASIKNTLNNILINGWDRFSSDPTTLDDFSRMIPSSWITDTRETSGPIIRYTPAAGNLGSIMTTLSETYDNGWYSRIALTAQGWYERTKNLLVRPGEDCVDDINVNYGAYINSSGKATASPGDAYTNYIPVEPGQEYYWYGVNTTAKSGNKRLHGYSAQSESNWVSQLGLASNVAAGAAYEVHITIPSGVNYIRCSFIEADTNVMLELAPKTSYELPYHRVSRDLEIIGHISSMAPIDSTQDQDMTGLEKGMPLILSYNLDTLYSSSLEVSKHQPNVAYVFGQGIGADKEKVEVDEYGAKCLDRCEVVVDARDVSQTSYLAARGQEYLAKYGTNFSYTFEASPYIINRYPFSPNNAYLYQKSSGITIPADKNVEIGYYGTIVDDELGIKQDFEITAITEIYQADGFHLELELGYDNENIRGNFNIVNAQTQSLINAPQAIATNDQGYSTMNYGLTITKGTTPYIHLDAGTENANPSGVVSVSQTGNYLELGIHNSWGSGSARSILLYNSTAKSAIKEALILRNSTTSGNTTTSTDYTILHTGNIAGYRYSNFYVTNLSGTGTITCPTINATSTITCPTINATTILNTKTVHIEDGYYPMFELKPTANSVTKVCRVEGSLYGNVSLQAWDDAAGNNRSLLVIHDPVAQTNIANVLQLRQCVNGTWSDYPIFHKGNATFPHQVVWTNSASDWGTITSLYGGSWSSVGSITVGSKTLYAYERNS